MSAPTSTPTRIRGLPAHLWAGLVLLAVGHVLIFGRTPDGSHLRPFSDYWFAWVWYGYIFVVDALVYRRDGRSLFVNRRRVFLAMLPLSAAMWWGFEWINGFVHNWYYDRPYDIPDWWANLWSCIFFSTVMPAIWETTDWVSGWRWLRERLPAGSEHPRFKVPGPVLWGMMLMGVLWFLLPVLWPLYFFPLIWGFLVLILDPINYQRGLPSLLGHLTRGDYRMLGSLYVGGLICGLLWEMWNFRAFPKWHYSIPFVDFAHVFEMPLPGYLGYGPFAWEVYSLFWFMVGLVPGAGPAQATRPMFEETLVED
jgi:hypothetical protein